jgi:hypothetical protein
MSQICLAKSSAIFSKYSAKKWNTVQISLIIYSRFLIGLKYETITKIANKIQQFPAKIIQKNKHLGVFRSDKNGRTDNLPKIEISS